MVMKDDHEVGVQFVNHEYRIGQHKVLLPINQNYYKIGEKN